MRKKYIYIGVRKMNRKKLPWIAKYEDIVIGRFKTEEKAFLARFDYIQKLRNTDML